MNSSNSDEQREQESGEDDSDDAAEDPSIRNRLWLKFAEEINEKYETEFDDWGKRVHDCVDHCLDDYLLGVRPIRTLIAVYAVERKLVWMSRKWLQRLLKPFVYLRGLAFDPYAHLPSNERIFALLKEVGEDEMIAIHKSIFEWDPRDSHLGHYLYPRGKHKMRLHPVLDACDACERVFWVAVETVKQNATLELGRAGVIWKSHPRLTQRPRLTCQDCITCK